MSSRKQEPCVGLDIGSSSVKVVEIRDDGEGKRLTKFGISDPISDAVVDGEIVDPERVAHAIKDLFSREHISPRHVVSSVSDRAAMVKTITMDLLSPEDARILERLRLKNLAGKKNLIEDLKKRKSQQSVLLLVEMLQDESWYLREQAVQALSEAGPEAREPILRLLEEGLWYARAAAAKVLGRIGGEEAVERLTDCLLDSNKTVQGAAASALVDIAKSSSVEDVAKLLSSRSHDVKQKAVACLRLLDRDVADGVLGYWDRDIVKPYSHEAPGSDQEGKEKAAA